jgi:carbonic anhydrase
MHKHTLVQANAPSDVLPEYVDTPIELLLRYHNMGEPLPSSYEKPVLLVGMCMDHRKDLRIPNEFAYVLRAAGANLRDSEFEISYAVAVGGVSAIALIGHSDCGMVGVTRKRDDYIKGLVKVTTWTAEEAGKHFDRFAPRYEINDAVEFTVTDSLRLRRAFPRLVVAPLFYNVSDDRLAQIRITTESGL